jgi:hypothetical protein
MVWFDSSGNLQTWLATAIWAGGSSFDPTTWLIINFRGAWAPSTAYSAGDVVLAADTSGNVQAWVAKSSFTSGYTFAVSTNWQGALAARQIFYVVALSAGQIQISTTAGGNPITFMTAGFFEAPDPSPVLNCYFGPGSFGTYAGLLPSLTRGVLFAQGTMWRPATPPTVAAAPTSQLSFLAYNSTAGLYWTTNPAGTTAGDAVLGWVLTNATDIVAASSQNILVASVSPTSSYTSSFSGGTGSVGGVPIIPTSGSGNAPSGISPMPPDVSNNLTPNLLSGAVTYKAVLVGDINVTIKPPAVIVANMMFLIQIDRDGTGTGVGQVAFDPFYTGFSSIHYDGTASTRFTAMVQIQADGLSAQYLFGVNGLPVA